MAGLIVLDRDGVINHDSEQYVKSVDEWVPIDGSLEAIARLCEAGFEVVVVTNQSGLARGLFSPADLEAIHAALRSGVEALGGRIAGIFFCPHHPDEGCSCRKPEPGLVHQAEQQLGVRAEGAPFVGDKLSDIEAAKRAGCRPILVRSGYGDRLASSDPALQGVEIHRDLSEAVTAILAQASD
jgi:D-glycero-D-manno-heptose 1,7-bisphosphate phosphatase